jgi:phospholipid/cholesterol/gamma-HCH transport system ATP-binding protein
MTDNPAHIEVRDLTMAYNESIIMQDLNFTINRGEIFAIMGASGCGKSTLMRHMIGLMKPLKGDILIEGENLWQDDLDYRERLMSRLGVLYQSGALFSSLTLAENVAVPLEEHTRLNKRQIREIVDYKLSLVSLSGYENYFPSEISGGMRKRAGLARAMALDPQILFIDEPSAGLDPISSKRLDNLIMELRDSLQTTIVVVTHELVSIFDIVDRLIFLDADKKTITACGNPNQLIHDTSNEMLHRFLTREV